MTKNNLVLSYDMSDAEYFGAAAASNSMLNQLAKSPAHLRVALKDASEPTPAQRFGTAFHIATLEPMRFDSEYARGSELRGNTKEGKAAKAELEQQYDADKILKPADYDAVCLMRDNVLAHPIVSELMDEDPGKEVCAFWEDESTGVQCKAKIDILPKSDGSIIDLKSTLDASPEAMAKTIAQWNYHRQAGHYLSAFDTRDEFYIIACEKKPPYAVAVYLISAYAARQGAEEIAELLQRWAELIDIIGEDFDGEWPGYDPVIYELDLPRWAQR